MELGHQENISGTLYFQVIVPVGPGPVLSVDSVAVSLRLTLEGLPAKTEAPPGSAILLKECLTCPDLAGLP